MFVRVRVFALLSLLCHPENLSVNDRIHRLGLEAGSIRVTTQAGRITSLKCGLLSVSSRLPCYITPIAHGVIGFNRRRGIDVSCYRLNPVILRLASGRCSHRARLHVYIRPDRL